MDAQLLKQVARLQFRVRHATRISSKTLSAADTEVPTIAPVRWLDRANRQETPVEFVRREYKSWLGRLSRAHIRQLDRSLYTALNNWLAKHKSLPPDLDLPTKKELNDRQIKSLGEISVKLSAEARDLRRLYELSRRRKKLR